MNPLSTNAFALPERLAAKADPALIAADEVHFAAIARSLQLTIEDLEARLAALQKSAVRQGQAAMDRDIEIHRLNSRLRALRRFGLDLCLGRIVSADESETLYIGRLGLADSSGQRLLVDWRSPAAEPFFAATHANPMGVRSRRRYRWIRGRIADYWDEVFSTEAFEGHAALDDQSAFIASLGTSRSPRMRDVLATIQADQDAIIRAGSRGALVVDGGPGTGKTVVALHRAAYLLYADPRLGQHRGGVLFVGPHRPYLDYIADVLPSLGEEGVQTCTMRDLVVEGSDAEDEYDVGVAGLKSSVGMVEAIEAAVAFYEEPPKEGISISTEWADVWVSPVDWAEAFAALESGTPHNEAREQVLEELVDILIDNLDDEESADDLRAALMNDDELLAEPNRSWPVLQASDIVSDLWTVPAYLRRCAPWLTAHEVEVLQRPAGQPWTTADLPLLDAARQRLGDATASTRRRRQRAAVAAAREEMASVIEHLIESDDSEMRVMSMLRGEDLGGVLIDERERAAVDRDLLAGPFAHVLVDEAQELTDAEWQMLISRCPSRSFTVVGDRAQARRGFAESWQERLARVGLPHVDVATMTINYRTPAEVMAEAEPVIRAALPDANVPTSIRSNGIPVRHGSLADLQAILDEWLAANAEGMACVICRTSRLDDERVVNLTPQLAKGLEFDLVILLDPDSLGGAVPGAVDRYVSMTRATQMLAILS